MVRMCRLLILALTAACFSSLCVGQDYGQYRENEVPPGKAAVMKRSKEKSQKPWVHQLMQNGIDLNPEKAYVLTFWARGTQDAEGHVSAKMNQPPWGFMKLRHDFVLDSEWHSFTFKFPGTDAVPGNSRLTFNFRGPQPMEMWVADVALVEVGGEGANLLKNGRFEKGLKGWALNGHNDGSYTCEVVDLDKGDSSKK